MGARSDKGVLRLLVSAVVSLSFGLAQAATYVVPTDAFLVRRSGSIVVGRPLTSYTEDSPKHGIETVTVVHVEDVLKGDIARDAEIKIRIIGGVYGKRMKLVPGAPRLTNGQRTLIFLTPLESGDYALTDLALGTFRFQTDDESRDVLIRDLTEIKGWDPDGTVHHEARRDADLFLRYVAGIARHTPLKEAYIVDARPLVGESPRQPHGLLRVTLNACSPCAPTQYTLVLGGTEADPGVRWNIFPAAANYNRGNNATNATNNGSDAINGAFASWNGDAISNTNLVLAATTPNTNGIFEPPDGVNNIVFEKNLGTPFSCAGGGLLGQGGIQIASGTSTVGGETFNNIQEVDVSMNQGVNACIGTSLSQAQFTAAITHEIGHTIGLRHADQTRIFDAACTTQLTYDCSDNAVMTAFVTYGPLKAWDLAAVASIYRDPTAPAAPTNVVATATSTANVQVTWTPSGASSYHIYRSSGGGVFAQVPGNPTSSPFNDTTVAGNTAYVYKVRGFNGSLESVDSNKDLATTVVFTDTVLVGITVKVLHLTELRNAVDRVRALAGLGGGAYDEAITNTTPIRAHHIDELRQFLASAMLSSNIALPAPTYTHPTLTPGTTLITALDISEIRSALQ